MAKRSNRIIKDIAIVVVGVVIIWFGITQVFGTSNPFYVVASGSMIPVLEVDDVLIVQGHVPFEDIEIGDIIVFDRPSDHNRVIVHRVAEILSENPKEIRTKGDANPGSIRGTDFPITEEEYIGKVEYTIPQVGYVTKILKPPVNYVIIAIVIGVMIVKEMTKKKTEKDTLFSESSDSEDQNEVEKAADIDKIERDSEYSQHVEESDTVDKEEDKKTEEVKEDKEEDKKNGDDKKEPDKKKE